MIYKSPKELELLAKVEPVIEDLGLHCRDIEIIPAGETVVRVTVDRPLNQTDSPPIAIDDCSKAHRALSPMFDVWDPFPGAYTLEFSSPGEKPRLRLAAHFVAALGEPIRFQTLEPVEMPPPAKPRKNWDVKLLAVDPQGAWIEVEDDAKNIHRIASKIIKNAIWLRTWNP